MIKHRTSLFIVFILAVCAAAYIMMNVYFRNTERQLFKSYVDALEEEYGLTLDVYSTMTDLLFLNDIDTGDVKQILSQAYASTRSEDKDHYRRLLHEELSDFYENIISFDLRQLHFHEQDSTSFLRFHKPGKYGDSLLGIRTSVEYVNENREKISGFEEGRIFNGYRNVYPLFLDGQYLGSVEISVSISAVLKQIQKRLRQDSQFIIQKSIVERKVFDEELVNYEEWPVNDEFLLDAAIARQFSIEGRIPEKDSAVIGARLEQSLVTEEGFSLEILFDGEKKVIAFIPVKNFEDQVAGYIYSISDNGRIAAHRLYHYIITVIFAGLLLFIIFFMIYYRTASRKIENMIIYDPLTQTYSRRMIFTKLEDELNRFKRYKKTFSICMVDIDHFKSVNDNFGHLAGDSLIAGLGSLIRENIRVTDSVGRYGGDEMLIILPECDGERALTVMKHIQAVIADTSFNFAGSITISGGIAEADESIAELGSLIEKADNNLYAAKEGGRDRIVL